MPTLAEIAGHTPSGMLPELIYDIINTNPLMGYFDFGSEPSLRLKWWKASTLPTTGFRASRTPYTASKGTIKPEEVQLHYYGGKTEGIDRNEANIPGFDGLSERVRQVDMMTESIAYDMPWQVVKSNAYGIPDPAAFDGVYALVNQINPNISPSAEDGGNLKWTGAANANGVALGTDAKVIMMELRRLFKAVNTTRPTVLLMPDWIQAELESISSTQGSFGPLANAFQYRDVPFVINGETLTYSILMYRGSIPCIDPGFNSQGAAIMDFDETWGTSDVTGSIVALRIGVRGFRIYQQRPIDVTPIETEVTIQDMMDWPLAPVPVVKNCIARTRGIKKS